MIFRIAVILLLTVCWVLSLVNASGLGVAMGTPTLTLYGILLLTFLSVFRRKYTVIKIHPGLVMGLIASLVIIPYFRSGTTEGLEYFCTLLLVYVISTYRITASVVRFTSLIYGALGLVVLWIYLNQEVLDGWNDNAISMYGLFSFLFFSIFLLQLRTRRSFILWNIVTVLYLSSLLATDCRSGMLFSIIAVVSIVFHKKVRGILSHKFVDFLIINIPLIIAGLVIWFASTSYFDELNLWSIRNYNKMIFSNRETLWQLSFDMLDATAFMGSGKFMLNYHNSGVAAICVFGLLGYICWAAFFISLLWQLRRYMRDPIVFGSVLCFCLIYLQQSVDLGFISPSPNLIPYVALGVACGRANTISSRRK